MFVLMIDVENDAFQNGQLARELARLLRTAARRIELLGPSSDQHALRDLNGNCVGNFALVKKEEAK